ncbi:transcriptional regulator [Aeromonas sp. S12(2024)]|uniref:winged helix-turn-helix domain-containing protein n=1 Tax=Aeromonas sp. S12(2024) TaxID=3242885 RepID=UPI0035291CDD
MVDVDSTNRVSINSLTGELRLGDIELGYLNQAERRVLIALLDANKSVLNRYQLLELGWPGKVVVPNSINMVIRKLRAILEPVKLDHTIVTIPREGFFLSEPSCFEVLTFGHGGENSTIKRDFSKESNRDLSEEELTALVEISARNEGDGSNVSTDQWIINHDVDLYDATSKKGSDIKSNLTEFSIYIKRFRWYCFFFVVIFLFLFSFYCLAFYLRVKPVLYCKQYDELELCSIEQSLLPPIVSSPFTSGRHFIGVEYHDRTKTTYL